MANDHECKHEAEIRLLQKEVDTLRTRQDANVTHVSTLFERSSVNVAEHVKLREDLEERCDNRCKSVSERLTALENKMSGMEAFVWKEVRSTVEWTTAFRGNLKTVIISIVTAILLAVGGILVQMKVEQSKQKDLTKLPNTEQSVR